MATYDLNRSELNSLLASDHIDPAVRKAVLDYLKNDFTDPGHTISVQESGYPGFDMPPPSGPPTVPPEVLIVDTPSASVNTADDPNLKAIIDISDATLTVTGGGNIFVGTGPGDDLVDMKGTTGDDVVMTGSGNDTVLAGTGEDSIYGGNGDDKLFAGASNQLLDGGNGNDTLDASNGGSFDTLVGGSGADSLVAGNGDGQLLIGDRASADTLGGGDGDDDHGHGHGWGHGHDHDDWSGSGGGKDTLVGGDGSHDTLIGGNGKDLLIAGDGDHQLLIGGNGNDTFEVDSKFGSHDTIVGGSGHDTLQFTDAADSKGAASVVTDHHTGVTTISFGSGPALTVTGVEEVVFGDGQHQKI